jgi:hypothetical protein
METELAQDKAKWCDSPNRVMKYVFRTYRKYKADKKLWNKN